VLPSSPVGDSEAGTVDVHPIAISAMTSTRATFQLSPLTQQA
jgi:hypothetical protein